MCWGGSSSDLSDDPPVKPSFALNFCIWTCDQHSGALDGLDDAEPDVPEELRKLDNAVLLPHLGSATRETRIAMGELVLENLQAFLDGREPPCRVA